MKFFFTISYCYFHHVSSSGLISRCYFHNILSLLLTFHISLFNTQYTYSKSTSFIMRRFQPDSLILSLSLLWILKTTFLNPEVLRWAFGISQTFNVCETKIFARSVGDGNNCSCSFEVSTQ